MVTVRNWCLASTWRYALNFTQRFNKTLSAYFLFEEMLASVLVILLVVETNVVFLIIVAIILTTFTTTANTIE